MLKIEKGVPIPARRLRRSYRYDQLERLHVGDSFIIEQEDLTAWRNCIAAYHRGRNENRRATGQSELRFQITKDDKGKYRCWRLEDIMPVRLSTRRGYDIDDEDE